MLTGAAAVAVGILISILAFGGESITGRASVIDGDTIEIHGQRIRLWGIDAPEGRQRCVRYGKHWRAGTDAANAFDRYLASRPVTCEQRDIDRYKRIVARCAAGGEDVAAWLVREGWALDYTRYSEGAYAAEQEDARLNRRGIWQGKCEAPWDWRRR